MKKLIQNEAYPHPLNPALHLNFQLLCLYKNELQTKLLHQFKINSYLQSLAVQQENNLPPSSGTDEDKPIQRQEEDKSVKNQTKNIPKNFGKAIISFIEKNQKLVKKLMTEESFPFEEYMECLRGKKRNINSIAELRSLWVEEESPYACLTRKLSVHFLKRSSLKYIFKSRITNYGGHVKYRNRLIDVLRNPHEFKSMKIFFD